MDVLRTFVNRSYLEKLWENKKVTNIFLQFFILPMEVILKLFKNCPLTNALKAPIN